VDPEKFPELKEQWTKKETEVNYQKAVRTEKFKNMASLMEKKLNSIRIDDTIMVQNNIVLEPIR
jgi:hypothetical protein